MTGLEVTTWFKPQLAVDDPPSNGRVESELNQWKRRLRLTMKSSGASPEEWPAVGRHAMEERTRAQLRKVGLPMPPMIRYNAKVLVKTKVWQRRGTEGMASPYFTATLKGPSPTMSHGWLVKDPAGLYQHARMVVVTDPLAEQAVLVLEANPTRPSHRLHGKQSLAPKIPAPVLVEGGDVEAPVHAEPDGGSEMYSPSVAAAEAPGVVVPEEALELRAVKGASTTDECGVPSMLAGGESFSPSSTFSTSSAPEGTGSGGDWVVLGARASTLCSSSSPLSSSSSGVALVADGGVDSLTSSKSASGNLVEDAVSPSKRHEILEIGNGWCSYVW